MLWYVTATGGNPHACPASCLDNPGYAQRAANQLVASEAILTQVLGMRPDRSTAWTNLGQNSSLLCTSPQARRAFVRSWLTATRPDKTRAALEKLRDSTDQAALRDDLDAALQRIDASP